MGEEGKHVFQKDVDSQCHKIYSLQASYITVVQRVFGHQKEDEGPACRLQQELHHKIGA